MSGDDRVDLREAPGLAFWLIILTILVFLTLLIGFCVCCAIRCFAPENTLGPAWEHNTKGSRFVRPLGHDSWWGGWLAHGAEYDGDPDVGNRAPRLAVGVDRTQSSDFPVKKQPTGIPSVDNRPA